MWALSIEKELKAKSAVNYVLSQGFDSESDIEQKQSRIEDNVEDPDYEASSDENNILSINCPVMAQPPAYITHCTLQLMELFGLG